MESEISRRPRQAASVMVPLDGSTAAMAALPIARIVARVMGAVVSVIHVSPTPLSRKELLHKLKLRPDQMRGIVIDPLTGQVATSIIQEAERRQSKFIAMSLYANELADILGPVAREVLEKAPCPVILVRPDIAVPPGGPGTTLRRILLPLDGTPSTSAASAPAIDLAERSGAELDILLVSTAGVSAPAERGTFVAPRYIDQPQHEWPVWTQEFITRFCHCIGACPTVPMRLQLATGNPAEEILRVAMERGSDLITLVWRGRLDGERGAVLKAVLRGMQSPALILRIPRVS